MTKWMKAVSFAAHKHRHQLRRDGRTPFIAHPFRVALIVRDLFGVADEEVLAAAMPPSCTIRSKTRRPTSTTSRRCSAAGWPTSSAS